jgi:hypothetical protein
LPLVRQVVRTIHEVDRKTGQIFELNARERKLVLRWKEALESLRATLLGVHVAMRISDRTLTSRQLTYVTIDSVRGVSEGGTTEVLFPAAGRGREWILNESFENRLPVTVGEPYRLLLANAEPFNAPHWQHGLEDNIVGRFLYVFIIHKATTPEESFSHRTIFRLWYAPRFVSEVRTPIVYARNGEPLVVRLTNHSRDGVRDEVFVNDTLVSSNRSPFRLNEKGAFHEDTLYLSWKRIPPEGTSLHEVVIGGDPVAAFAARSFPLTVDSSKRIGLVGNPHGSLAARVIRSLDLTLHHVDVSSASHGEFDVLLVDHRALTHAAPRQQRIGETAVQNLRTFAELGGHVIILPQDAEVWNAGPLWDGLTLQRTTLLDPDNPLEVDSLHAFLTRPNTLESDDWEGWVFRRGSNIVSLQNQSHAHVVLKDAHLNAPLLVTAPVGRGRMTYIDLNMYHQWLDVNPAAYRLLANMLSY